MRVLLLLPRQGHPPAVTDKPSILLIEDDYLDSMGVERELRKLNVLNPLHIARNGREALNLLRGEGVPKIRQPAIVLLDINMPRMNGFEFLEHIRQDPDFKHLKVFIITTPMTWWTSSGPLSWAWPASLPSHCRLMPSGKAAPIWKVSISSWSCCSSSSPYSRASRSCRPMSMSTAVKITTRKSTFCEKPGIR
jgi:CheY-like chemotaxis protein